MSTDTLRHRRRRAIRRITAADDAYDRAKQEHYDRLDEQEFIAQNGEQREEGSKS